MGDIELPGLPAPSGTVNGVDIDAIIDAATPAERSMTLCLAGDLVVEYEELERRRAEATLAGSGDSLAGSGGAVAEIDVDMDALRPRMLERTITVVMRAMPRKPFNKLVELHPPRRDDDGKVNPEDNVGVNNVTFWEPLIRACWASPTLTKARLTRLLDEVVSDRQYDELAALAWAVNRATVDVPFSSAASRQSRDSLTE